MANPIRHEVRIPRITLHDDNTKVLHSPSVVVLPSGAGRTRTGGVHDVFSSLDPTMKNPIHDPSANEQIGITFHIGGIPYGQQ